jgi:cytochrome P450
MTRATIPDHIPAELVREYDYYDMGEETDVYRHYKKLHDGPDLFYSPLHGGYWVATRYADMEEILNNAEDFSSRHQTVPHNPMLIPLIEHDGAIHEDFRRLLSAFFTPKSIRHLEGVARDLTVSLIDGFYAQGECDFVVEFSKKMPIKIVMGLLGFPDEDTAYLTQISEDVVRSGSLEQKHAAFGRVFEYMATKVIPARRANPGDDIFSAVIRGTVENGRSVTDEELVGLGGLLVVAGLDTVAGMLGYITKFLAENPGHRKQLVDDPGLINNALEEMMRRHHLANIARVATRDLEFNGVQIKQGESILVPTSAAGIDERRYPDAMTVDFKRGDKKTLVFGRGPHQCIGSLLARTELRVFLEEWLSRIPDYEIKAGEQPVQETGSATGILYLPLTWKVA